MTLSTLATDDEFDDAPVRSFVVIVAERRIRECLREDQCSVLTIA
jgi:hypothetical protein